MASSISTIHRVAVMQCPLYGALYIEWHSGNAHQSRSPGVRGVAKEVIAPPLEVLEPPNYKVPAPKSRVGSEWSLSGLFGKE